MKKSILYSFAFMVSMSAMAQTDPTLAPGQMPPSTPVVTQNPEFIQFKEQAHDFGNIKQNVPASYVFEFKNVGNRDITLINVAASCGCTTPNWKGGIYKAGETAQITATFNAGNEGFFSKNVTVTTSEGVVVLSISGTVMAPAAFDEWKAKKDAEEAAAKANEPKQKGTKGKDSKTDKKKSTEKKKSDAQKPKDSAKKES